VDSEQLFQPYFVCTNMITYTLYNTVRYYNYLWYNTWNCDFIQVYC